MSSKNNVCTMQFVYNYEDGIQSYEKLLEKNFIKLSEYSKCRDASSSELEEMNDVYIVVKKCLNTAQESIATLKSEYSDLTQHFLHVSENNFKYEFLSYLERQEVLRMRFLEFIYKFKLLNSRLDDILCGKVVETMNEDSAESPSESAHATDDNLNTKFDSSSGLELGTSESFPKFDSPMASATEILESLSRNEGGEVYYSTITSTLKLRKSYVCVTCGRRLSTRNALKAHILTIHQGVKPFSCAVCGQKFTQRSGRNRHQQTAHVEGKPYCCTSCDKRFKSEFNLERHLKRNHCTLK
ncbi:zinc finger protein 394-like isoform X2 [Planococcus citri]|uniref:zinc finger protein 394-like isoform X2 n=1 Tax=Planococcus citri TaxID=170843 RepID=UPI0031F730EF